MNDGYWMRILDAGKRIDPISPPVHPSESVDGQAQPASGIGLFLVPAFNTKLELDKDL
jgi:anti-sigma regulatory factor (Ser/Thr protein kinase)